MAGNDFNLDDILVDDILEGFKKEGGSLKRECPDDAVVDSILAGIVGEEELQREDPPRDSAVAVAQKAQEPQEEAPAEPKRWRKKGGSSEESPEGYWGDIKGITEKEGPSAQELHKRRVEEKMKAYKKARQREEQKGVFGRKIRTEQLSRTMDLPVVNPIPASVDAPGLDEILEKVKEETAEAAAPPSSLQENAGQPVLRIVSKQEPGQAEMPAGQGSEDEAWRDLLSDEAGGEADGPAAERAPEGTESGREATVRFSHLTEPEETGELKLSAEGPEDEGDERETLLSEKREQVKSDFKIGHIRLEGEEEEEEEPGNVEEEEEEPPEEIEDFESYDDTLSVNHEFVGLMTSLISRLTVLCVLFLLSLYLTLSAQFDLLIPPQVSAADAPVLHVAVHLALVAVGVAVSAKAVFSGLGSLFTGKANSDSVCSLVCLGATLQSAVMFFFPDSVSGGKVVLYSSVAILSLMVNAVGKLYIINRTRLNFKLVSTEDFEKRSAMEVASEELLQYIPHDTDIEEALVCAPVKTGMISNFLRCSYQRDITDRVCRWAVPVVFLCSALMGVLSYFVFHNNIPSSVSVFAAGICVCAPVCAIFNTNIPLFLANSRLVRAGAMITNYEACEKFGDVGCLVMDLSDLLPEHSVKLNSIKTFKDERIDEVLLEVASLTHSVSHPLSKMFLQIIDDRFDLLKMVESVVYEENMGISGWVETQRVLLGNRDMMTNHGVLVPGKDFERKYLSQGYDLIYFSRGGKIAAIFIVQYEVGDREKEAFAKLEKEGMRVYVRTYDANISDKKLAELYGTEQGTLTVLPFKAFGVFDQVCGPKQEMDASIAYTSDVSAFIRAILAAMKIKNTANLSNLLMLCSMGLGLLFVALLVLFGAMAKATIMMVLLYQLFWMILLLVVLNFHRY